MVGLGKWYRSTLITDKFDVWNVKLKNKIKLKKKRKESEGEGEVAQSCKKNEILVKMDFITSKEDSLITFAFLSQGRSKII